MYDEIQDIYKKLKSIVKRAYVSRANDDSGDDPATQITFFGNKTDDAERISPYGLYTNLPEDTQVLLFCISSHGEDKSVMGYARKDRFKNLEEGEVVVGNIISGTFIKFNNDGSIDVEADGNVNITTPGEINIDGGDINIVNGTVNITGDATVNADNVHLNATQVNLGSGGNDIARVGDSVLVNTGTGIGTITSGGINTSI